MKDEMTVRCCGFRISGILMTRSTYFFELVIRHFALVIKNVKIGLSATFFLKLVIRRILFFVEDL